MFLMVLMMIRIAIMLIIITSKLPGRVTCQCYINTWARASLSVADICPACVRTTFRFCVDLRQWIPHRFGQRYCCRVPKKEDSNGSIETPELC